MKNVNIPILILLQFFYSHCIFSQENLIRKISVHTNTVRSLDISHDGKLIASWGYDNCVILTDFNSGAILNKIQFDSTVVHIEFSNDEKYLLAQTKNAVFTIELNKKEVKKIGDFSIVWNTHYGTNSNEIYVNGSDKKLGKSGIFICDVRPFVAKYVIEISNASDFFYEKASNKLYVVCSNLIREFDVFSLTNINTLISPAPISSIDIFPNRKFLGAATSGGRIIIYNLKEKTSYVNSIPVSDSTILRISKNNYIVFSHQNLIIVRNLISPVNADSSKSYRTLISDQEKEIFTGGSAIKYFILTPDEKYFIVINNSPDITVCNNPYAGGVFGKNEATIPNNPVLSVKTEEKESPQYELKADLKEEVLTKEEALTDEFIYNFYKNEIDRELNIRPELFLPKGEFEKSVDYEKRNQEAIKFRKSTIEFYRGKYIDQLNRQKYLDSLSAVRNAELLKDKIRDSYKEIYLSIQK